jgi:hypothetical protein
MEPASTVTNRCEVTLAFFASPTDLGQFGFTEMSNAALVYERTAIPRQPIAPPHQPLRFRLGGDAAAMANEKY